MSQPPDVAAAWLPLPIEDSAPATAQAFDETYLHDTTRWLEDVELRALIDAPPISVASQRQWFESLPTRPDYLIWGLASNGQRVGVFGLKNVTEEAAEYWGYIGEKTYWGRGLGRWMLTYCLQEARLRGLQRVWLRVLPANTRAIHLYQRLGFQPQPGVGDALLRMERQLAE